jgi:hypothetical protein
VVRMAEENPTWGYTRISGVLKNVGIVLGDRLSPASSRRRASHRCRSGTSWRTFLRAHWGAIAAADFFTTEVWTWRGLVTYYTVFVINLASRRVHMVGSTPHPDERFMGQVSCTLTAADDGVLVGHRVLICDRDRKWTPSVRQFLDTSGIRVVQTPFQAPNANADRRTIRALDQGRVSQSSDSLRGTPPTTNDR